MAGLLPENPSFGGLLGRNVGQGLGAGLLQGVQHSQKQSLEKLRSSTMAQQAKTMEKARSIENGLGTIERMRELLTNAGGWSSDPLKKIQSLIPGELQKNRSELESLGRSLIPLVAAGVPIRNQREFNEYSKVITDASSSPSQMEGALNGIQNLLERSFGEKSDSESDSPQKTKKVKFSSQHPEHRKKAEQLFKKFNDKEKVREILSREFEF